MKQTKQLTEATAALFLALARNAGNWGGTPLFEGGKADCGRLSHLKQADLLDTFEDERGDVFVTFTDAGRTYAAEQGVTISD